jgi:hypothetical protein
MESELQTLASSLRYAQMEIKILGVLVLFLFGTTCALWAQNTKRNGWLWFIGGVFFNWLAALNMLSLNARSQKIDDET